MPAKFATKPYPFKVTVDPSSNTYKELNASTMGTKTFDFSVHGLAHYGMLADFIEALRQFETGADIADYFLFRTADDTIKMWENIELAASKLQ